MRKLLVIEDGSEYTEFAQALLGQEYQVFQAQTGSAALALLSSHATSQPIDALLIDLRFDRTPMPDLLGEVKGTAMRLFGGDSARAIRYLQDQQGILILAEARRLGHRQPAVFVHDFPERRIQNLRKLYGAVCAVPVFDAGEILRGLRGSGQWSLS
jgi:CheY-like chemotaxis protein